MSTSKYSNRDALNQALDLYLDAMFLFVSECLDEQSIREALRLLSGDDLSENMEVKDIAALIKRHWSKCFKEEFKIIDRYGKTRYYDARSVTSLIVEGRNQVSHQRLKELDPEFTRSQLFLIAEVLGKINEPDAQGEVETIRDQLFDDTSERLETVSEPSKAVEVEKTKYEKSIAKLESHLADAKKSNKELSKQIIDNAVKLDEKKEELEKLSERLVGAKLDGKEYEKRLNSTSKQLEKVQTEHSACEERLTTISDQLASIEAKRDDYKKHLETASTQLDSVKVERSTFEERLTATSNELALVQAKKNASDRYLAVTRNLLTTVGIRDQSVFPPLKTDSVVRILDRRGMNKRDYLLELLEQKQPTIIYVQSEEMVETLLDHIVPEKADSIEKHGEQTSKAEEMEILEKLEGGELIAVVSSSTISTLPNPHHIEHFVFCHPVPDLDEFFKQCQPAFTSERNTYLHLIYNSEQDVEHLNKWLVQKYPEREVLEKLYPELKKFTERDGNFINTENLYSESDIAKLSIETGIAVFEELQLLERNGESIKLLAPAGKKLDESEIYNRGEKLKEETADFRAFQLEHSIEQIWEKIVEKLNVDTEHILRERDTFKKHFKVSKKDSNTQPTTQQDKNAPPILDVWPQRGMSAFNALRQQAANTSNDSWIREDTEGGSILSSPMTGEVLSSPVADSQGMEDHQNKYDLALQFAQEHGINALEEGVAQLIKDRNDPDYSFTIDEMKMLRAFQEALKDSQTQPEQSTEVAVSQATKGKVPEKKPSIAERYTSETTEAARDELAVKIAKIRINATGSKPIAWHKIREKFGLKNDQFHKVIRLSAGYRKAVIDRIKQLKSRPEGWEYSGKLERLTGIELSESELK